MKELFRSIQIFILFSLFLTSCKTINYTGSYTRDLGHNNYSLLYLHSDEKTFSYASNEYANTSKPYMPAATMPSDSIGEGTYFIKRNKIYFDFGEEQIKNIHLEKINENYPNDKAEINITVLSETDSLSLIGAEISYFQKEKKNWEGRSADFDGNATLKISEQNFPLELNIKYLGYSSEKIIIKDPAVYQIKAYLYESPKKMFGQRVYPIQRVKDTLYINGLSKIIYKTRTKKKK